MTDEKMLFYQKVYIYIYLLITFVSETLHLSSLLALAVLLILTIALSFKDAFTVKGLFKSYKADTLVLFFFINILSMILNVKYGFSDNIFCLFTLFVNYFIMYNVSRDYKTDTVKAYFKDISDFLLFLYTDVNFFLFGGIGIVVSIFVAWLASLFINEQLEGRV